MTGRAPCLTAMALNLGTFISGEYWKKRKKETRPYASGVSRYLMADSAGGAGSILNRFFRGSRFPLQGESACNFISTGKAQITRPTRHVWKRMHRFRPPSADRPQAPTPMEHFSGRNFLNARSTRL